ncbi:hypothetical protein MmiAt1_04510 [Methanimicrococcus sp. At1]|uniref:DNA double-strand break repair protein Mre11 n=1 Tax=Methanimicrococcus hacksteinii TaxID=3028293 RepID=A0ABU3VNM2_9EURY|nr:metallophosphoesterase [Methanimicrococcus sp. At1]MDV0444905.1 hypothetical protein [Methanimicrococcus sp. At1]
MDNVTYRTEKSEIKILHTGDTHLGSRQYHSDIRRRDFFESFSKVIRDAVENNMDAVIHTGDLFDSRNPSIEDLMETIAVLTELKKAGIPFLGIVGNHEGKQNTQWLDIFETMGLAERLGSKPVIVDGPNAQIYFYGIDNLSGPRLAAFDFSVFECPPDSGGKKTYHILALHQLLDPVLPGQPLSADDFTGPIPIQFDAVLLGDNHKYECIKHNGAWLTYPGSTERCSAAETEPRSYNILTFENEMSITRRSIQTRDFVTIPISGDDKGEIKLDEVYTVIDSYSEKIKDSVVFIEFTGTKKTLIPISEIEEYVKNKGAVVARVGDKRDLAKEDGDKVGGIVFRDPDEVVRQELKKLNLTEAGLLLDSIIRDSEISKTNITDASEIQLKEFLENTEFNEEFRRESVYSDESFDSESNFCSSNEIEIETDAGNGIGIENESNADEIGIENPEFAAEVIEQLRRTQEIKKSADKEKQADKEEQADEKKQEDEEEAGKKRMGEDETAENVESAENENGETDGNDIGETDANDIEEADERRKPEISSGVSEKTKRGPGAAPRQYTLGDMFGPEDES